MGRHRVRMPEAHCCPSTLGKGELEAVCMVLFAVVGRTLEANGIGCAACSIRSEQPRCVKLGRSHLFDEVLDFAFQSLAFLR